MDALFDVLCDDTVLVDPANGVCCRNQCSSCAYYDVVDGEAVYKYEYLDTGRWLAAQSEVSVPPLEFRALRCGETTPGEPPL